MRNLTLCEEKEAANGSAAAGLRTAVDADADAGFARGLHLAASRPRTHARGECRENFPTVYRRKTGKKFRFR